MLNCIAHKNWKFAGTASIVVSTLRASKSLQKVTLPQKHKNEGELAESVHPAHVGFPSNEGSRVPEHHDSFVPLVKQRKTL